jgi:gliding motility-associated-like protein
VRATIVVADLLDFGCASPGDTATRPLSIQNSGNIPLVLAGATNSTPYFIIRGNLNNRQIPPRSSIEAPIDFMPNAFGNFLDQLTIRSNDLDRPIATVDLRGCGSNGAPVFDPIGDQTIFERDRLILNLIARDPENNSLILSAQNLPSGATFVDQGGGRGQFSWRPDFGAAGQYSVTFLAQEQNTLPPLSGLLIVNITVLQRRPELYIAALSGVRPPVRLNQVVMVTATFADSSASALQSFYARLSYDNQITLADTLITSLQSGANVTVSRPFQLTSLGRHFFQATIDATSAVAESNENNNTLRLEFDVQPGQLAVAPNPFTPNNDGFNDAAVFDLGNVGVQSPQLKIFDLHGNLLKTIASSQAAQLRWDGNDNSGKPQPPGLYLYLLLDADKKVASGYVVLAR